MKNRWKHIFIPVLAMALCLSLAACGESNEDYGDDGSDCNLYGVPDSFEGRRLAYHRRGGRQRHHHP